LFYGRDCEATGGIRSDLVASGVSRYQRSISGLS
jgi:hypothetical protein